jgi:hypothetical protein
MDESTQPAAPDDEIHRPITNQEAAESTLKLDPQPSGPTGKDRSTKTDRAARSGETAPPHPTGRIAHGVLGFRVRQHRSPDVARKNSRHKNAAGRGAVLCLQPYPDTMLAA